MNEEPKLLKEPRDGVPEVIDTLEAYKEYCSLLAAGSGPLAADAERASGFRYNHEDWLIQFKRKGAGIGLLDPVALKNLGVDWHEFNEAIGDSPWIIHDSMQDLPGFFDIGLRPRDLFDTEIAAKLLGRKRFGLSSVTEYYLGLTLAKEHSAADWSYRPLPRDWRNYAALDVELLIELEEVMRGELKKQGKLDWAKEEFKHLLIKGAQKKAPHPRPWLKISHINVLMHDRVGLIIAKDLWQERDALAQKYDIAPNLLLSDSAIIEAGKRKPRNARDFRSIRSLNERVRIHTGSEQDKMFERYAPIQRKIKPSLWKNIIEKALNRAKSGETAMDDFSEIAHNDSDDFKDSKSLQQSQDTQSAPRSMRYWKDHHPARYERLQRIRAVLTSISQDTHTPVEVIIKPQIIRNLCWCENITDVDVYSFFLEQGARPWQVALIAESVTRAIM
ncbi:ribonuclease D [Gardnerella vaginalis 6119V5]|uniref:HRDC domain-containing protein n=1 Tax=Gardnerella vaginalis TaxID=2702 RepID=UPI0002634CDA|nr:HRDC domain-containing protein [Gardnerella vaginalis]EIK87058.1 ribonuclease D [Gardnerella vaginalis 6119V5]